MIWISQHFIRVLAGARGLPGWHFLASPPPPSPFTHAPPVPFFLAPHCRLGNKAHCFSPLYACASPRAAPACCACALLPKLGWGEKKGAAGLANALREPSATDHGPVSFWFLHSRFFRFLIPPYPPPLFFLVILHPMLQIGLLGISTPPAGGFWARWTFKRPSNSHLILVTLLLISLYYFVLTPLPPPKIFGLWWRLFFKTFVEAASNSIFWWLQKRDLFCFLL